MGKGSRWGNNEIRYSIRSLFKHTDVGRIFIIGQKPNFFHYGGGLYHIPLNDARAKEVNIWEKALKASEDDRISEQFFFINDDHFFLNDFTMCDFPNFHKGNMESYKWSKEPIPNIKRGYDKKAAITYKLLKKLKLTTWHYDIHTPKLLEKSKFRESYKFFRKDLYRGTGLLIFSSYCNYHNVQPTKLRDIKLRRSSLAEFFNTYHDNLVFSISDDATGPALLEFMERLYPEKSPFEK